MAEKNKRWRREMMIYVCYTLPYAFWPAGIIYALHAIQGHPFRIADVVADGGILTTAIGLNMGSVWRLSNDTKWLELKIAFAGLSSFAMLSGSFFYGYRYVHGATSSVVFVDLCVLVFIVSVAIATFCRLLPEDNQ
jgi:hypothetical protein